MPKPEFEMLIERSAEKDLRRLPEEVHEHVIESILPPAQNPWPPGSKKLAGSKSPRRIRVGDYRILHDIADKSEHRSRLPRASPPRCYAFSIYWSRAAERFIVNVPELPVRMVAGANYEEAIVNAQSTVQKELDPAHSVGRSMSTVVAAELELTEESIGPLIRNLSPHKVERLLVIWQISHGGYAQIRDPLFAGGAVISLFEQAPAYQAK